MCQLFKALGYIEALKDISISLDMICLGEFIEDFRCFCLSYDGSPEKKVNLRKGWKGLTNSNQMLKSMARPGNPVVGMEYKANILVRRKEKLILETSLCLPQFLSDLKPRHSFEDN